VDVGDKMNDVLQRQQASVGRCVGLQDFKLPVDGRHDAVAVRAVFLGVVGAVALFEVHAVPCGGGRIPVFIGPG
jgi:hypothetical protein